MTINEAIAKIDSLKPNAYTVEEKLMWLSTLDATVYDEIISTHEDNELEDFDGYDMDTDGETELLVKSPYDEMYIHYMSAQIDYFNGEYDKFNNSNMMYSSVYSTFRNAYNRKHLPLGRKHRYF